MPPTITTKVAFGHIEILSTLLSGVTATGNGEWVQLSGFRPCTVHITGITTATVELDGHNDPSQPSNSVHGFKLNDVTADGAILVEVPVEWIKARVTSYTSGTISAFLVGSEEG